MPDPPPASSSSSSTTPKAIPSLAKRTSDTTRRGAARLVFTPTLPARRKKEDVKKEEPAAAVAAPVERGRGRGRGDRVQGRGRGGEGRGAAPRPPPVEMTASGPFAMGPALAGTSARRTAPRSNFAPAIPQGPGALGAGLTQTTAPALRRLKSGTLGKPEEDEEVYSDPDEGVEIVDMERIREMDWMAPESLAREQEAKKRSKSARVKKEDPEKSDEERKGPAKEAVMDVDESPEPEQEVNLANAVDLSESEDEEELEDIIDDFAFAQQNQTDEEGTNIRQERLYFFQFPSPFPVFTSPSAQAAPTATEQASAPGLTDRTSERKVTFALDTKPPAQGTSTEGKPNDADQKVDGVIGQLEVYASGAVKMRLANGILMDVTAATQPSFLQQAVHVDVGNKRMHVLGEVNRRFVVSPNVEALLAAMELAEQPAVPELEGLIAMDIG